MMGFNGFVFSFVSTLLRMELGFWFMYRWIGGVSAEISVNYTFQWRKQFSRYRVFGIYILFLRYGGMEYCVNFFISSIFHFKYLIFEFQGWSRSFLRHFEYWKGGRGLHTSHKYTVFRRFCVFYHCLRYIIIGRYSYSLRLEWMF